MELIPLKEFQRVSGLSDGALLWLLKENRLPIRAGADGGVQIEVDGIELPRLIAALSARQQEAWQNDRRLLLEKCASLIKNSFAEVIAETIARIAPAGGE
jgi:hypothetical protein